MSIDTSIYIRTNKQLKQLPVLKISLKITYDIIFTKIKNSLERGQTVDCSTLKYANMVFILRKKSQIKSDLHASKQNK